jgi:hypothetical protein
MACSGITLPFTLPRWGWVVSITSRPRFTPGERTLVPIGQEAGWTPEPVWTQGLEEKSSASVGDRTPIVQSVANHYSDWATQAPEFSVVQTRILRFKLIKWSRHCSRLLCVSRTACLQLLQRAATPQSNSDSRIRCVSVLLLLVTITG